VSGPIVSPIDNTRGENQDDIESKAVLAFASQAARELRRLDAGIWRERLEGR
jgi:hypothetical protein